MKFGECLENVHSKMPLIHNITNYVTVNDVANVLLACGGSPIMADAVTEENLKEAVDFVKNFAKAAGSIVAVTGAIDLVSDGERCYVIRNGKAQMGKITGTGCQLSGLMTAYITANPKHMLDAAAAAVCVMGVAGEIGYAHLQNHEGNATYRNRIIDAIANMDAETLEREANYELY